MNDTVKMTIRMSMEDAEAVKRLAKLDGYSAVNSVYHEAVRDLLAERLLAIEPGYEGVNMGGSLHKSTGKAGQ